MPETDIWAWLQTISDSLGLTSPAVDCQLRKDIGNPARKRRRLNPPTPDTSQSNMDSADQDTSPGKRGWADGDYEERTPRAPSDNTRRFKVPRSESSLSQPSSSSRSQHGSGYSSPTKQLNQLAHDPRGVVVRDLLTLFPKPPELATLLNKIQHISRGRGILPTSHRQSFDALDTRSEAYHDWGWVQEGSLSDMHFSDQRQDLGPTPPTDIVQRILYQANFCSNNGSSEADWNTEVHHRLLEASLRPLEGIGKAQLIDFRSSTTASIIPSYHANRLQHKKVDFCLYIEPKCDSDCPRVSQKIEELAATLPHQAFNHTGLPTLNTRPIALSIETKKSGEGWENAKLQMGIWNAAHWEFLQSLLRLKGQLPTPNKEHTAPEDKEVPSSSSTQQQLPLYLPGIIIQGHDWHLIITTREDGKTLFWHKVTFGSTSSSMGIYQIICTLQLLRQWAKNDYWSWLCAVVMDGD